MKVHCNTRILSNPSDCQAEHHHATRLVKVDAETATRVQERMAEHQVMERASSYVTDLLRCVHCRVTCSGSAIRAHLAEK